MEINYTDLINTVSDLKVKHKEMVDIISELQVQMYNMQRRNEAIDQRIDNVEERISYIGRRP